MKQNHPNHVKGYVSPTSLTFGYTADDFHHFFEVRCKCGSELFLLSKGTMQTVKAQCPLCSTKIILYELSQYPAASKAFSVETFDSVNDGKPPRVIVAYEYGQLDDDQSYDPNDITWCTIWLIRGENDFELVLDDETA